MQLVLIDQKKIEFFQNVQIGILIEQILVLPIIVQNLKSEFSHK
jgi:hypothetical protein